MGNEPTVASAESRVLTIAKALDGMANAIGSVEQEMFDPAFLAAKAPMTEDLQGSLTRAEAAFDKVEAAILSIRGKVQGLA
jgi:hypothetical protein